MNRKSICTLTLILCVGFILVGCPKKTVVKEDPSLKKAEEMTLEREQAKKLEAERAAKEAREKEMARIREEEARKEAASREAASREAASKAAAAKEFEKSLTAKRTAGVEGTVYESRLLKDIYFDFDKYDLHPDDAEVLKANAVLLRQYPNMKIQIEGHCDERGTLEYNLALGQRRANATKRYLTSLGISESRISTISYGEEHPFDTAHNEEAWSQNRRAHFVILSK